MPPKAKIRVPGSTSNLGSGFDAVGLALDLSLTVEMEIADELEIAVSGEEREEIATDANNMIYRAAEALYQKLNLICPPLKIFIENHIPVARGLGSSGAAIIAGLLGAARLSGAQLTNAEMLDLAGELEGHPENAASSLLGGLTINCNDHGRIVSRKLYVEDALRAVLLIPAKGVSTKAARQVLPEKVRHSDAVFNAQRSALLVHAFMSRDYFHLRLAMQDRLHQPFRKRLIPHYDEFESTAFENGAAGVCISGSGSAILALAEQPQHLNVQQAWQSQVEDKKYDARVVNVEIENSGAQFLEA